MRLSNPCREDTPHSSRLPSTLPFQRGPRAKAFDSLYSIRGYSICLRRCSSALGHTRISCSVHRSPVLPRSLSHLCPPPCANVWGTQCGRKGQEVRGLTQREGEAIPRNTPTGKIDPIPMQTPTEENPPKKAAKSRDVGKRVACGMALWPPLQDGVRADASLGRAQMVPASLPDAAPQPVLCPPTSRQALRRAG